MEIYNLGDFKGKNASLNGGDEERKGGYGLRAGHSNAMASNGKDFGGLKITGMRQGVRNPERVNVFVNSKFSFSLDVAQVVDFKLKVGKEISEEELAELKKASEFGKMYQRTLEWVLLRPRSERETIEYLRRKLTMSSLETLPHARLHRARSLLVAPAGATNSSEDIRELSAIIIERLKTRGYLDDLKFAEWYVENRFVKKGVSTRRLKMELAKKGISKEIIEEVMTKSERSDVEELKKMIAKKRARYTDEQKLMQYLVRQGFSYGLVREVLVESSSTSADE